MMQRRFSVVLVLLAAIAGCLTTSAQAAPAASQAQAPQRPSAATSKELCPPGKSQMGCAQLPPPQPQIVPCPPKPTATQLRSCNPLLWQGAKFPDTSIWQGFVNWSAVAAWQRANGWPTGGIFKLGEFRIDPQAANSAAGTRQLSWRAGYWFVRNTGCDHEAQQIVAAAHAYGLRMVAEDLEVPEAAGYGACLTPRLRHAGLIPIEYTGPGTNPGGVDTSAPLWEATYGTGFMHMWSPTVAWQCTDGVNGCVTNVPGIGRDDVSIDFGISHLFGPPPPPPDPFRVLEHVVRHFGPHDSAREYNTAKNWKLYGCRYPLRRMKCQTTHHHLFLLAHRIWVVAHHNGKSTMNLYDRHLRFAIMWRDLNPGR